MLAGGIPPRSRSPTAGRVRRNRAQARLRDQAQADARDLARPRSCRCSRARPLCQHVELEGGKSAGEAGCRPAKAMIGRRAGRAPAPSQDGRRRRGAPLEPVLAGARRGERAQAPRPASDDGAVGRRRRCGGSTRRRSASTTTPFVPLEGEGAPPLRRRPRAAAGRSPAGGATVADSLSRARRPVVAEPTHDARSSRHGARHEAILRLNFVIATQWSLRRLRSRVRAGGDAARAHARNRAAVLERSSGPPRRQPARVAPRR